MRALRVVGLGEDGKIVILESDRGERFQIPADERLRAAARGDITRLGQIAIELESQMRPREIQSRIRAGESVEQVAAAAGVPPERVERFAYPVLLERSRTAELAQRAHPVREDGPDVQELGEVVAQAFAARGQDYAAAVWDSWKGEDGKWVVQLTWTAGRSNNHAHWSFHPGAHGGTVTPLDDHALDLLDPNPNRGLRTVRPVTELAAQALQVAEPRRQAVNGGEPPRRVEEPDYVQDFELTDDAAAPVGLVEQQELPVGDPYGRGFPRDYRPEQYRRPEPEPYRPEPEPY
ncbi:MAG: septation protein SepH, partial [Actinomycetota bacterium]|nr:septation protein SepH [Actinomycetota bacterium]